MREQEAAKPKGWKDLSVGSVKAYCRPGYEKVLTTSWRLPKNSHKIVAAYELATTGIHNDTRLSRDKSMGKLAGLRIHSATRRAPPDIDTIEMARKAGINVEKPLAVVYPGGRELPVQVLERIRGVTLGKFLEKERSPGKRKRVLINALEQLNKLHGIGLVHGDCHRKNFMVTPSGAVYLIDLIPRLRNYCEPIDDLYQLKNSLQGQLREGEWPTDRI
jgi:RIO-like serine/threonine protein kinase